MRLSLTLNPLHKDKLGLSLPLSYSWRCLTHFVNVFIPFMVTRHHDSHPTPMTFRRSFNFCGLLWKVGMKTLPSQKWAGRAKGVQCNDLYSLTAFSRSLKDFRLSPLLDLLRNYIDFAWYLVAALGTHDTKRFVMGPQDLLMHNIEHRLLRKENQLQWSLSPPFLQCSFSRKAPDWLLGSTVLGCHSHLLDKGWKSGRHSRQLLTGCRIFCLDVKHWKPWLMHKLEAHIHRESVPHKFFSLHLKVT